MAGERFETRLSTAEVTLAQGITRLERVERRQDDFERALRDDGKELRTSIDSLRRCVQTQIGELKTAFTRSQARYSWSIIVLLLSILGFVAARFLDHVLENIR